MLPEVTVALSAKATGESTLQKMRRAQKSEMSFLRHGV